MLSVSLAAGSYLVGLLDEVIAEEGVGVRLKLQRGRRISMRLDHAQPEDAQIKHGRRLILLLEPRLQRILLKEKLHLQLHSDQQRLIFTEASSVPSAFRA